MPTSAPITGNTEGTMPENCAFYPALDGLRAIAFLLAFSSTITPFHGAGQASTSSLFCLVF